MKRERHEPEKYRADYISFEVCGYNRRKIQSYVLIILLILGVFIPEKMSGQCDSDTFLDKCASNLGSYNYIKSFVAYGNSKKKNNTEFSYVFSKGSTYKMIVCNEDASKGLMIINLYDRDHNLISSSYDSKTGRFYNELLYPCSATGLYYIKTSFTGSRSGSGMCILGFDKTE